MSRLGGLGIQAFTNLSGNASRLMSQAFDRTLNSQQFLISQLEQERQRKLQQGYAEEQQQKAEDEALKQQLIATGIGVAGGALTGGVLAAAAPAAGGLGAAAGAAGAGGAGATAGTAAGAGAAALGAPALASGVSGATLGTAVGAGAGTGLSVGGGAALGGLIGGLSTLPGGQVPAQLIGQSTPIFNPQIGINNQRLALDSVRLANDTLATNSLIQSRRDNSKYQRDKLNQDANEFNATNQRLLDAHDDNLAFKYNNLGSQNDRFFLGEIGKNNRQQQGFENSVSLEGVRQGNRIGLEDVRQGNRISLSELNGGRLGTFGQVAELGGYTPGTPEYQDLFRDRANRLAGRGGDGLTDRDVFGFAKTLATDPTASSLFDNPVSDSQRVAGSIIREQIPQLRGQEPQANQQFDPMAAAAGLIEGELPENRAETIEYMTRTNRITSDQAAELRRRYGLDGQ